MTRGWSFTAAERRQNVAPGVSPGFLVDTISAPEGRKNLSESFAPFGAAFRNDTYPGLAPRGYILSPLRG